MIFRLTLILTLLTSVASVAQTPQIPKLDFETYDFPRAVVVKTPGKDKSYLKSNIEMWIDNYFTDTSLINSEFENDTFRINAKEDRFFEIKNLPTELHFQLKLSLKDNRYRFEVTSLSYKYYTELYVINNINLIKDDVIKNDLENSRNLLSNFFNALNLELYKYINSNDQDW
ncbi:DUF4468 domain-containing protein [Psychroflexus tropicus]|uniref:DUF4468 domain-containing protein n=1 Tax=Psychroflexus tropicus TaxID=197345 RepID=UPI00036E8F8E|nr:DUF4468 domain-containing protein [Psychroflexus tropicus]